MQHPGNRVIPRNEDSRASRPDRPRAPRCLLRRHDTVVVSLPRDTAGKGKAPCCLCRQHTVSIVLAPDEEARMRPAAQNPARSNSRWSGQSRSALRRQSFWQQRHQSPPRPTVTCQQRRRWATLGAAISRPTRHAPRRLLPIRTTHRTTRPEACRSLGRAGETDGWLSGVLHKRKRGTTASRLARRLAHGNGVGIPSPCGVPA
jgi:hypothetical protein